MTLSMISLAADQRPCNSLPTFRYGIAAVGLYCCIKEQTCVNLTTSGAAFRKLPLLEENHRNQF
jgi:hypothetical protein